MTSANLDVEKIRQSLSVTPYVPVGETTPGAPWPSADHDDQVVCPCGAAHQLYVTAYGWRAECPELDVRWTSLHSETTTIDGNEIGLWVAEPYAAMKTRSTW